MSKTIQYIDVPSYLGWYIIWFAVINTHWKAKYGI
jgi:hypothetical protein